MKRVIDGLLIVDKPDGITSLDVVREIKHRFGVKKAGHIGTLDPFATGVLQIVLNEGTKLVPFLNENPKEYDVVLKLGEETTTDDWTGEVVQNKPWEGIPLEKIEALIHSFIGKIHQIPPMFSAIKIQGKPLYQMARKGIEVERKEREIEIYKIQMIGIDLPLISFRVSCSKGTYIRTLGRDIGKKIGCGAHLLRLRRVRSGSFTRASDLLGKVKRIFQTRCSPPLADFFGSSLTQFTRGDWGRKNDKLCPVGKRDDGSRSLSTELSGL